MPISSFVRLHSPDRPQLAQALGRTSFTALNSIRAVPLGASTFRLWWASTISISASGKYLAASFAKRHSTAMPRLMLPLKNTGISLAAA